MVGRLLSFWEGLFSGAMFVLGRVKWRNPHLYKLYGYGLCKGKPTRKIAEYKVQYLRFRYLKFLVILGGSSQDLDTWLITMVIVSPLSIPK